MLQQFAGTDLTKQPELFDRWANKFEELPLYFLRYFGSTSVESVLDAMEYACYIYDVEHIVLDNLQFMLSGQSMSATGGFRYGDTKFDLQDRAIEMFRAFATAKNVHITLVIHPRKEADGQKLGLASVFGGAKATQEADNVIIIQRGVEDPETGNEITPRALEIKKNRFDGDTGRIPFTFDKEKRRIVEQIRATDHKAVPPPPASASASAAPPVKPRKLPRKLAPEAATPTATTASAAAPTASAEVTNPNSPLFHGGDAAKLKTHKKLGKDKTLREPVIIDA